jgi:hypothetical protein
MNVNQFEERGLGVRFRTSILLGLFDPEDVSDIISETSVDFKRNI